LYQDTIYNNYDEGWRKANGGNDYNNSIPTGALIQQIRPDMSVGSGRTDYLAYKNAFGHKFRFTGINGGYYDEADGTYYTSGGTSSDLATEYPEVSTSRWWVIDHLS